MYGCFTDIVRNFVVRIIISSLTFNQPTSFRRSERVPEVSNNRPTGFKAPAFILSQQNIFLLLFSMISSTQRCGHYCQHHWKFKSGLAGRAHMIEHGFRRVIKWLYSWHLFDMYGRSILSQNSPLVYRTQTDFWVTYSVDTEIWQVGGAMN